MSTTPPEFAEHEFRKATRSDPDKACVRVARRDGWVEVRDDKTTFGAIDDYRLLFTTDQFDAYLTGERTGELDGRCIEITRRSDGMFVLRSTVRQLSGARELLFTDCEIAAFRHGLMLGEFDISAYGASR